MDARPGERDPGTGAMTGSRVVSKQDMPRGMEAIRMCRRIMRIVPVDGTQVGQGEGGWGFGWQGERLKSQKKLGRR